MCGIYGVIGSGITKEDLGVFHTLAFLNQLRGMHSTGVARVFRHSRPEIRKDTIPAMYFLGDKKNETITRDVTPLAVMGHNRHATVGNAQDINGSHPFETKSYIGFHNGTLVDKQHTTDNVRFLTDSESLWNAIEDSNDLEGTVARLSKDSAFTLAYYNKDTKMIGFIRNGKRPLAVAAHSTREVIYYSSDILDLEYALDRMQVDADSMQVGSWKHIQVNPAKINFSPLDPETKERHSLWKVSEVVPDPQEPKPTVTEYFIPSRGSNLMGRFSGKCQECCGELTFKSQETRPTYVKGLGYLCHECCDEYIKAGIDLTSDDADFEIYKHSHGTKHFSEVKVG